MEDYLLPAWESDANPLEHLILASGTEWVRQGDTAWQLYKTKGLENKAAVRELLDYYGLPTFVLYCGEEKVSLRLDEWCLPLLEVGLGISVENVKRAHCCECTERQIEAIQRAKKCCTESKRCNTCEQCENGHMLLGLLQPAVDDDGSLHFILHNAEVSHRDRELQPATNQTSDQP